MSNASYLIKRGSLLHKSHQCERNLKRTRDTEPLIGKPIRPKTYFGKDLGHQLSCILDAIFEGSFYESNIKQRLLQSQGQSI